MKQLTGAMSKMSIRQIRNKKDNWGLSGLEKAYDALLEVVSYPLLYRDMISVLNIECPKGMVQSGCLYTNSIKHLYVPKVCYCMARQELVKHTWWQLLQKPVMPKWYV
jgi:hypothetical protein